MGGCASTPKGIDLTKEKEALTTPSKTVEAPQTVVVAETGNGGDVEKKEAVTGVNKAEEAKPEAAAEVKTESSLVEAVTEKKDVAVDTTTEEKKAEAVVAPKAEIAEKAAEPSKVEEKTHVSPPVTTA